MTDGAGTDPSAGIERFARSGSGPLLGGYFGEMDEAMGSAGLQFFTFEGRRIPFETGDTIGSALLREGIVLLRHSETGAPRGILCGIGVCWECRCVIDDRPNTRACMAEAREGAIVRRQEGLQ